MQALPNELVAGIQDMACRTLHNGSPSRIGLILVLDVTFSVKIEGELERALDGWVWDCLDRAHRALDFGACWKFVSNVRRDQDEDEQWEDGDDPDERAPSENKYQVCVNIEPGVEDVENNGLFLYAPVHSLQEPVDPARVLEHFTSPPREVRGVAISGVNQDILRDQWISCIAAGQTDEFDRPGKGYMEHPMWVLPEGAQDGTFPRLAAVREQSCMFGWPDYPGALGHSRGAW